MSQRSLDAFFGLKTQAKRPREEEKAEGEVKKRMETTRTSEHEPGVTHTESKKEEKNYASIGNSQYFTAHREEFFSLLNKQEKPTANSMATLLKEEFNPLKQYKELWPLPQPGSGSDPVPYAIVADALADISATSSRLECIKILTNLLCTVISRCPEDLVPVFYLVVNKQAPQHEGVELGIGDSLLVKVVAECCGMTEARAKEAYQQCGDLAELAQNNKQNQSTLVKPKPLSARGVFSAFKQMALMSGKDVMRRRADTIKKLLRDAKGAEVNLIVRALQQKMRIGLAESSSLASLGYAFTVSFLGAEVKKLPLDSFQLALMMGASNIARIFYEVPDIQVVINAVLSHGFMVLVPDSKINIEFQQALSIRPGLPVKPQLAHPTSGITVVLNRFQGRRFTSEYKYDGERAQIHYENGRFHIFSRNSETHTGKYPDVVSILPSTFDSKSVDSFIIDSEVVAVNEETGALKAFQVLQHRGRKNIAVDDVSIPVCIFAFDILYLNGEPLLKKTLQERRDILYKVFKPVHKKLSFATHLDSDNVEDIQKFLEQSITDGCEGLMIKTLDENAEYTPSKRSHFWLKLKKDYMDGVTDTLDLVPMAAFYGKGKRTGVFGGFLLGCYDAESDEYQSICKIGTGFQDEELEKLTSALKDFAVKDKPRYYRAEESGVDVWLKESQVWEVKAADLSISPVHFAAIGLVDPSKGIALRFPRYMCLREDKKPTDATTARQVMDMYNMQSLALNPEKEDDEMGAYE